MDESAFENNIKRIRHIKELSLENNGANLKRMCLLLSHLYVMHETLKGWKKERDDMKVFLWDQGANSSL